jgi:hypothetical protein
MNLSNTVTKGCRVGGHRRYVAAANGQRDCSSRWRQRRTDNVVFRSLVTSGLVVVEDHPLSNLYRLNRRHLAAPSIKALADLSRLLRETMHEHLSS